MKNLQIINLNNTFADDDGLFSISQSSFLENLIEIKILNTPLITHRGIINVLKGH
jgi:hypothetical protein